MRARAGFEVMDLGAPMDVLWMRISRKPSDPAQSLGHVEAGRFLITLDRGDYWQCAFLIRKGSFADFQARGMEAFHREVVQLAPYLSDRIDELRDWQQISLLSVTVDRLRTWCCRGLLCIGDAAHAMSPIGGVGINLAIQDAIATANALVVHLRGGNVDIEALREVQRRREFPTRMTQGIQLFIQNRFISRVLNGSQSLQLPLFLKMARRWPILRRIPARIVGIGFRPEHIKTPETMPAQSL
ncbi:MAG TPA: FAD-dependent monooxygenase, partial [Candidatus Binataceae bacterium]|nr:FAD-dependent monooxygenase [Candidatus Binataceae bacterium]